MNNSHLHRPTFVDKTFTILVITYPMCVNIEPIHK